MGNCFHRESSKSTTSTSIERHPQFIDEQTRRKIKKQKMKRAGTGYPGKKLRKKRGNRTGHSPGWTHSSQHQATNYDIFFIEHSEEPVPLGRAL